MKKRQLLNILALLMSVMCTLSASAYDFEVDGIYYNITSNNTVEVTHNILNNDWYYCTNYREYSIVVPNSVFYDGVSYKVTAIGDSAFWRADVCEITIPEAVTSIGRSAFYGLQRSLKLFLKPVVPPSMEDAFDAYDDYDNDKSGNNRFYYDELHDFPFDVYDYNDMYDGWYCEGYSMEFIGCFSIVLYVPSEAYQAYKEVNERHHLVSWIYGYDWEKTPTPPATIKCYYSVDKLVNITVTFQPAENCKLYAEAFYHGLRLWWPLSLDYEKKDNGEVVFSLSYSTYEVVEGPPARYAFFIHAVEEGKLPSDNLILELGEPYGELWPPYDRVDFDFMESGICYRSDKYNYYPYDWYYDDYDYDSDEVYVASPIYGNSSYNYHRYVEYSGDMVIPTTVIGKTVMGIDNGALGRGNAFENCVDLTGISMPNTIKDMFWSAFTGCTNLKRMILPVTVNKDCITEDYDKNDLMCELESLYFTGDGKWYSGPLPSLKTLYIGTGVTGVEYMNVNPTTIYSYATTPPICNGKGENYYDYPSFTDYDAELHVPASSLAAYFTAPYWCNFTNIIGDITPISDFSLGQDSISILKGSQFTFDPIITPAHVVPDTIIWQSTNKSVATVKDGVVTAVGTGECEIQAICQGKFVICRVFVTEIQPTEVVLSQENAKLEVGETLQLSATVLPANATNKTLYWSTSDSRVATVSSNGLVTAIAPGNATITASTGYGSNLRAPCTVVVTDRLSDYDNYLSLNDVEVFHGDTIVIPVAMTNAEQVVSFQTDILLPEGLEIVKEDGEYLIDPSDRMTRTHSIMSNDVSSGAVRVMCYSSNYKPFTGNSGDDLFYITVKVNDDAKGDYIIQLENTLFTTSDFEEIAAPDVAAILNVKAYLLGDVNGSGAVTVTDVVLTAQYVLEQNPQPFIFEAADVNADGNITVTDVTRIAWMVLNPTQNAPRRVPAMWNSGDCMSAEAITLKPGETRKVSIMLDNTMAYSAFQFDLGLPDGLIAGNFQLTDRAGGHALAVNSLGNGDLRALCYSPALDVISGHDGALLTFDVTAGAAIEGAIGVKDIELVTADCMTVLLDGFAIGVNSEATMSELNGTKVIARVDYYNLVGQRIERPESGVTLVVTTYTDGTCTTAKVIK